MACEGRARTLGVVLIEPGVLLGLDGVSVGGTVAGFVGSVGMGLRRTPHPARMAAMLEVMAAQCQKGRWRLAVGVCWVFTVQAPRARFRAYFV